MLPGGAKDEGGQEGGDLEGGNLAGVDDLEDPGLPAPIDDLDDEPEMQILPAPPPRPKGDKIFLDQFITVPCIAT